jgi:TetR/AcrR family transcriptional regulator, mexJK operon transcriptional repressor
MSTERSGTSVEQQGLDGRAAPQATSNGQAARGAAKRKVIAQAATAVFLRDGYAAASMDEVAAVGGVSKQTVYKHFGSKEHLFLAVIHQAINGVLDEFLAVLATSFPDSEDLEGDLLRLGRILLTRVLDPELMAVRRLVIAEVGRFPQLGRAWYESGPGALVAALAESLGRLAGRGQLLIDDPIAAAADFNWLVVSKPQNMIMFGVVDSFTIAQLEEFVASAVRVFLSAYRPGAEAVARPAGPRSGPVAATGVGAQP